VIRVDSHSAFCHLDAPPERLHVQERTRAKLLPACCGTYALYERRGDLLYIGKAKNARARVRSHLRDVQPHGLLPSWTKRIHRIEVRAAGSELEALLVEAELVGKLRPPLNRQMRSWSRYCYLVQSGDPDSPLDVSSQMPSWRLCFGPYRTRRAAVDIVEAVFRLTRQNSRNGRLLSRCFDVLAGTDEALAVELEGRCDALADGDGDDPRARWLRKQAETMRKAFERGALLRAAERMLGSVLALPGRGERLRLAVLTPDGLRIDAADRNIHGANDFLERYRRRIPSPARWADRRLGKSIADGLCVAARHLARGNNGYRYLSAGQVHDMSARHFMTWAAGEEKG
jgi:hypothetical protein